jgi:hypothetical protein
MSDVLKLIRYNTGTDKKLFTEFASDFDAVIMNATIAAYSGSAMADLVSIYKDKYIIDPQTHILQQDFDTLSVEKKKGGNELKKSIVKYLEQLPDVFKDELLSVGYIDKDIINDNLRELVEDVGEFQLNYINSFIEKKEYRKYLEFIEEVDGVVFKPEPRLLVAPYFMLKCCYPYEVIVAWLELNKQSIDLFCQKFSETNFHIAAQLVLEKDVLRNMADDKTGILNAISETYNGLDFEYIFIWVDDFSPIEADAGLTRAFAKLLKELNRIGKSPIMAYGGYDSILLCHKDSPTKLHGVAQSVGYGEQRQITPVGGGLPTNKYYFPPIHQRLKLNDVELILSLEGFFNNNRPPSQRAIDFYTQICGCEQCKIIIENDIDNFLQYNESKPFVMSSGVRRNRPTQDAIEISARHYLHQRVKEWADINMKPFFDLIDEYKTNILKYGKYHVNNLHLRILEWIEHYAK